MNCLGEIQFGKDGLVPAVVQDANSGEVLMLAYMDATALAKTLETGETWFFSRKRQSLWHKGETSGNLQIVKEIRFDCDADALVILVQQTGSGACHTGEYSCFYRVLKRDDNGHPSIEFTEGSRNQSGRRAADGRVLTELYDVICDRKENPVEGSYTCYLFREGIDKILKKVGEESSETIIGAKNGSREEIIYETADLIYHLFVMLAFFGVSPEEVLDELARRR